MWRKSPTLHRIYGGIFRPWRIYPHSAPDKQAYRSSSGVCAADSMSKRSSSHFSFCSVREVQRRCTSLTEAYRSGHNEAVLKTVWGQPHGGSNPSASANKKGTFVYQKFLFLFIQAAGLAYHHDAVVDIISPCGAVSHHALACIYLRLDDIQPYGLMIYRNKLRMIYKACALILVRLCDIINSSINKNL